MFVFEVELNYIQPYKPDNDYLIVHLNFLMTLRVEKKLIEKTKCVLGIKEIIEFRYKPIDAEKHKQEIQQIMQQDPYVIYGIAEFKINAYVLMDYPVELGVIESSEIVFFKFVHNVLSRTLSEALNAETGEKIQAAKEIPAKAAGITGREYLLKSSALLCEKMNAMLEVACYENCITVAYLGSEEFKKTVEDAKNNLRHSISCLESAIQKYENHKAQLEETERQLVEKDVLRYVRKIKTHPNYAQIKGENNPEIRDNSTTPKMKADVQDITLVNFNKTLAEGFSSLSISIPLESLSLIADFVDPENLAQYVNGLKEAYKLFELNWNLLRQYKKAVSFPKNKEFSDLSLIVRYSGNFRSIEDSMKNAIMDYTPGNRCTDSLMQFSLNAINNYSKNFCNLNTKNRDEFRNIFIDTYVAMVNGKRNNRNTLSRIFKYLFLRNNQDETLEAEMLLQVLSLEKEIETKSIKNFMLFKDWLKAEINKLKTSTSLSAANVYPNFTYPEAQAVSQVEESVSVHKRHRRSNSKAKSKIKIQSLSVVTSNIKLEMKALFEEMIWYIDTYVELQQNYFHLIGLAQKLSVSSPIILTKINELFCVNNRSFLIGDKQLLEILGADKPYEMMEKLKKEAHANLIITIDKPNQVVEQPETLSAMALNWMKGTFLNSANVTPLSERKFDKSPTEYRSPVKERSLLSPPAPRTTLLLSVSTAQPSIGLTAVSEAHAQAKSSPNTVAHS